MSNFYHWDGIEWVADTEKTYIVTSPALWITSKGDFISLEVGDKFDVSCPRVLYWFTDPHDLENLVCSAIHDKMLEEGYSPWESSLEFTKSLHIRNKSYIYRLILFWATYLYTQIGDLKEKGFTIINKFLQRFKV